MSDFYSAVFDGNFEETKKYLLENFDGSRWNCPTGEEDIEGIIDVLDSGAHQPGIEEIVFEVDYSGNIRCKGDMETFASIVEGEDD